MLILRLENLTLNSLNMNIYIYMFLVVLAVKFMELFIKLDIIRAFYGPMVRCGTVSYDEKRHDMKFEVVSRP